MKKLGIALAAIVAIVVILAGGMVLLSESGEVVVLHTADAEGAHTTRLWLVEYKGSPWLRAGDPDSRWLERIRGSPEVEVERGGKTLRYRALATDSQAVRERINTLMDEKYGRAERLISLMSDRSRSVPIRLVTR